MAFTVDQRNAIDAETGTVLVAAAAGSGKTSVLTQRIIRKLTGENPVQPDELLVVTFTRAAAAEMKDRVYKGLTEMAENNPSRRREFTRIQSRLSDMNISTMDSFCMNTVKAYFSLLDIDADIGVLDTGEETLLQGETADELLEKILTDDRERFNLLSRTFSKTGNDMGIKDAIIRLSDYSMSEPVPSKWLKSLSAPYGSTDINCGWTQALRDEALCRCNYISRLLADCFELIPELETEKHRQSISDFLYTVQPPFENFRSLIKTGDWDELCGKCAVVAEALSTRFPVLRNAGEAKDLIKGKRDTAKSVFGDVAKLFCATSQEHAEDMEALFPAVNALTDTVIEYNELLLEKKKSLRRYGFSDIMHFTLKLLYDGDAPDRRTPLARELGATYNEILIDEYQDTNGAQDALFSALSDNGGNMFMVGDVKQSIYSFRLADPGVFMKKCDEFPAWNGEKQPQSKILLRENFRCRKGIVDAVNFIFGNLMSRETGDVDYDEDAALRYGATYYDENDAKTTPDVCVRVIEQGDSGESSAEAEARFIAEDIIRRINDGEPVKLKDGVRPCAAGDFAVLMRSPSKPGTVYKKIFSQYGLSVVCSKTEQLYEFAEVRLMLSLMKAVDNPGDDISVTAVMMSQFFGFTPDELAAIRLLSRKNGRKKTTVWSDVCFAAENGNEHCAVFEKTVEHLRNISAGTTASGFMRRLNETYALSSTVLALENGEIRHNNIMLLIDTAEAAEERGIKTAGAFVRYMDRLRDNGIDLKSAVSGGGENCVRLMSIHGSKGLEFPFVYISGLGRKFNLTDLTGSLIIDHASGIGLKRRETEKLKLYPTIPWMAVNAGAKRRLLSEEMRIYYVALTRAKENLILVTSTADKQRKMSAIESVLPASGTVPPEYILNCGNAADWFLAALDSHVDAACLRAGDRFINSGSGRAEIRVVQSEVTPADETETGAQEITEEKTDEALLSRIKERASFRYKYAPIASKLARSTASGSDDNSFSKEKFTRSRPRFIEGKKLNATDRGTANHLFMQFCDFEAYLEDAAKETERIRRSGKLTDDQLSAVDPGSVTAFLNSSVYERIRKADEIYRERRFAVVVPLIESDPTVPEEFADEKTVAIGQIDLLFVENGKGVIVDYKTDRVTDVNDLAERYRKQMEMYIKAVRMSMEIEVTECVLYSLKLHEFVNVKMRPEN